MKRFLLLLLLMVFSLLSCDTQGNNSHQTTDADMDTITEADNETETDDEDALPSEPQCLSEGWGETEIVADYHEIYDFEVEKSEEKWSWTKDGHIASIYVNGDSFDRIFDVKVVSNGDMYVAGRFTDFNDFESTQKYGFLNVYQTDGTLVRYRFTKAIWGEMIDFYFDDKGETLYALFNAESTEKDFSTGKGMRKSFIGILKDGKWSFKTWYLSYGTRCTNLIEFKENGWQMFCLYQDFQKTYEAFLVVDNNKVYRKVFSDENDEQFNNFYVKDKQYYFLLNKIGDPFGPTHPLLYKFNPNSLCISGEKEDIYDTNFIETFLGIASTENSRNALGVSEYEYTCTYEGVDDVHITSKQAQINFQFDEGDSRNIELGLSPSLFEKECTFPAIFALDIKESEEVMYVGGVSKFDINFLGRTWGAYPEEESKKNVNYDWFFDPFIIAVDGENIYARQLVSSIEGDSDLSVYASGDYVYLFGIYRKQWKKYGSNDPITDSGFIHRVPKSWILQKDAKIKDELLLLDEIIE